MNGFGFDWKYELIDLSKKMRATEPAYCQMEVIQINAMLANDN